MSSPQPPSDSDEERWPDGSDERRPDGSAGPGWGAPPPGADDRPVTGAAPDQPGPDPARPSEPTGTGPTGAPGSQWPPAAPNWAAPPPPAPGDGYAQPLHTGAQEGQAPQYPPPGYPPQGYQAVGYYPAPSQTDSKAIIALVLAVSSWLVCPILPAVVALVLAAQSDRAIAESGGRLEGRSMNTATKVVSWLNIAILGLVIVGVIILAIIGIATSSTLPDGSTQF